MRKDIIVGTITFKSQTELVNYTRTILTDIGVTLSVALKNQDHLHFLFALCQRHPSQESKLSKFIDFKIQNNVLNPNGLALVIINNDCTQTEISWRLCVTGVKTSVKTMFYGALRQSISMQIKEFKDNTDVSNCKECNCALDLSYHIDHHEKQFIELVHNFMEAHKEVIIPSAYIKKPITFETLFDVQDKWIGELFQKYHLLHATLRVLCVNCNLTRPKYKGSHAFSLLC